MSVTLINPPEKKRVWAGIAESMAYGVYCFPPLGLMYLQASLEKRTPLRCEIYDAIVDDMITPRSRRASTATISTWSASRPTPTRCPTCS